VKVIFFLPQLCEGGAQQVAVLLANALSGDGIEITLALASAHGELMQRITPPCKIIDLHASKPIHALKSLALLVKQEQPAAIVCFGIYTGIAAVLSKSLFRWKSPIVIRNENNLSLDWEQGTHLNRLIGPPLSRWAARHSHVVAVSHALSQATKKYLRIPGERITTILNPAIDKTIDFNIRNKSERHPWLTNDAYRTFVAIGRLEHQKGFDTLIDAFSMIPSSSDVRLLIFGEGKLRKSLQKQIQLHGMQDVILLAGHTNNSQAQMSAAHAFVLSSRFEGFGLVLVEALHAGARVISTDCDFGPAELLENGKYGTLVPVNDATALAAAMTASLSSQHAATRPHEAWFKQFTSTEAAHQHLKLIQSLQPSNCHRADNARNGTKER